jgi:hypothetical protein
MRKLLSVLLIVACSTSPSDDDASVDDGGGGDATTDSSMVDVADSGATDAAVEAEAAVDCGALSGGCVVLDHTTWNFTGTCGSALNCYISQSTNACNDSMGPLTAGACNGAGPIVSVSGYTVSFTFPGSNMSCSATVCGNKMTGECKSNTCTFTGTKQ